jgi:hypothetical protein
MNEEPDWTWNLFPRLRFRIAHGYWCKHPSWSPWRMVDLGRRKIRWCTACHYPEIV